MVSVQPRHIDVMRQFVDHRAHDEHGGDDLLRGNWAIGSLVAHGHPDGTCLCKYAGVGAQESWREFNFSLRAARNVATIPQFDC
jgi:hypothetical protein